MGSSPGPAAPDRRIWIDGELVPWERATVHVLSHGHQRGSLVFDYLSLHETPRGPAAFRLDAHVERFLASARLVGLPLAQDAAAVRAAVLAAARANPGATAVKLSAYLAAVEVDVVPLDTHVTLAVAAYDPVQDLVRARGHAPRPFAPLRVWLEKQRRNRRADILAPQAKCAANYASPMAAKWEARRQGYDEVLLTDAEGSLAEGPTTNVFLVDGGGGLRTPPEETVLHGITRLSILEIAAHDGIPARVERIAPEEIFEAAEAFLTGTTAGVWAIASVDGKPFATPAPGPVSRALGRRFHEISEGRDPEFAHWLTPLDAD